MVMKNGNILKEKFEYYKERLTTKEGLWDFFIATAAWGFIIITFTDIIKNFLLNLFEFFPRIIPYLGIGVFLQYYVMYLIYGLLLMVFGVFISIAVNKLFKFLNKIRKEIFKKK